MTNLTGLAQHITGLAHVGFVVEDLDAALAPVMKTYGLNADHIRYVPAKKDFNDAQDQARFAFVSVAGSGVEFEYIQPVSPAMKQQLLALTSGPGAINHLAYYVGSVSDALKTLAQTGVFPGYVTPNGPVNTGENILVYLNPEHTGGALIELIEKVGEGIHHRAAV